MDNHWFAAGPLRDSKGTKNYLLVNLCAERQPDVLCVQETHFAEGDTLDASFLPG